MDTFGIDHRQLEVVVHGCSFYGLPVHFKLNNSTSLPVN
jgi:hypothetical protein